MDKQKLTGTAYSYLRFSSPQQATGDSIRRQAEARDKWLERNPGVTLAPDSTYEELGTSSLRGKHRSDDKAALRQFIKAVESGRVKPGSFLIVESFDRLTREEFGEAAEFVLGLVNRGIRIVQLSPVEVVLQKPVDLTKALVLVVELTRGHGESQRKSDTIGAAWARKREECRESGKIVTTGQRAVKAWLELRGGKFAFKPGARPLIRRIFAMATAGHGCRAIARKLNDDGIPSWTGKPWYEMYVRLILRGREVLGEFQQASIKRNGTREPDGEPVAGYYPAAVTEAEWQAAQLAARARDNRGGRPTKRGDYVNVFQGLLKDARTGERLHIMGRGASRFLMPESYKRRGSDGVSFPLAVFERGILSKLAEIDPREILDREEGPDEVAELSAKLVRLDTQIKNLTDLFDLDDANAIPEVAEKVKAKNDERKALVEKLDRAKVIAATPLSETWGECRGLVEALDQANDPRDLRVRLRHAIARIVESITCLFVGTQNTVRAAAVRVDFKGGDSHRDYLILYQRRHVSSAKRERPAKFWVRSFAEAAVKDGFDLRNRKDTATLERLLSTIGVKQFAGANPVTLSHPVPRPARRSPGGK